MRIKAKMTAVIASMALIITFLIMGIWAATNATVNLGGTVSFVAKDVYATISGRITTANPDDDTTLATLEYTAKTTPSSEDLATWQNKQLSFVEVDDEIVIEITITNNAERGLYATLTESLSASNVSKTITYTDDNDETSTYAGTQCIVPATETVKYTITLTISNPNYDVDATFGYQISLIDEVFASEVVDIDDTPLSFGNKDETNKTIQVTSCATDQTEVTIPAHVKDGDTIYTVTAIADNAFSSCKSLTTVIIPKTVTSVGESAFSACSILANVYYTGSETEWNAISISTGNDPLSNATKGFNYTSV